MEQAKAAIKSFTSQHGQHDTTVHEHHQPAVTHEHVTPTQHENATTAVDREVHQEHHHTSIQPIRHREVLPEKHQHNMAPVEHKEHVHGDPDVIKQRLSAEAAQFRDVSETSQTQHTQAVQPSVAGEHHHHHVHEYVQPIVQKETVQPTVVHTTVPVHEVHHREPQHHAASALPAVSMADWKKGGGSLTGREERTDVFKGEPHSETAEQHARHGGQHLHGMSAPGTTGSAVTTGGVGTRDTTGGVGTRDSTREGISGDALSRDTTTDKSHTGRNAALGGAAGAGTAAAVAGTRHQNGSTTQQTTSGMDSRVDNRATSTGTGSSLVSDGTRSHATGQTGTTGSRYADTHAGSKMDEGTTATGVGAGAGAGAGSYGKQGTLTSDQLTGATQKPSLLQKLNPLKDADGDGKKGIMS